MTVVKLFFLSLFMSPYGPYLVSLAREFHDCYCKPLTFFYDNPIETRDVK